MAEQKTEKQDKQKPKPQGMRPGEKDIHEEKLVRILSKDIPGNIKVYPGLTRIKGISWGVSNAICKKLKIDKNKKIIALTKDEIDKIADFMKKPNNFPKHLMNRQMDFETGENKHLITTELELKTDFDIKRLKKIKAYRGLRHLSGLPSRGQRTRSHFRKNRRKGSGIKRKSAVLDTRNKEKKEY